MKNPVWLFIMSFSLLLLVGCGDNKPAAGSESIQSKSAGVYVSSSWHDDSVAHFLVKPTGELTGYLLVINGAVYEMMGTVGETGIVCLSIKDTTTGQPRPGSTTLGTSDGAGTLTGLLLHSDGPFRYEMNRVGRDTNRFYGIYKGVLTRDSNTIGTCWLGVDFNGKVYGFASNVSGTITGEVDASTGGFTLTTVMPSQFGIIITGTVGVDGSITNATWRNDGGSGLFSAEKMQVL